MKFKYIKGTEKDFEGAPEWALFKVLGNLGGVFFTEKQEKGARFCNLLSKSKTQLICGLIDNIETIIAQREPISESQAWFERGEPPPAGEEVFLVSNKKPECYFGKIIAFNGDEVWIDKVGIKNYKEYSFQPLKTKEQKEKEELRDDLSFITVNSVGRLNENNAAQKLYDMGWCKVDK